MSTVIRDVVIRVGIQNGQSTLSVTGVQQATTAAQQLQTQTSAAATAATNLWANLRGPSAVEAAQQSETAAEAIRKTSEELAKAEEESKKAAKSAADQARADKEATQRTEDLRKARTNLTTAQLQAGEASKQLMSGAMGLARAYAYMSAANEQDLQSAMKTIATFESVAHSISGVIDMGTGVVKVYRAMEDAGKATAAMNLLMAASQKAVAGAGGGVGSVAGSAVGSAAGGAAATVAGTAAVKLFATQTATYAGQMVASYMPFITAVGAGAGIVSHFGQKMLQGTSTLEEAIGYLEDRRNAAASEKKTADMEKRSSNRISMAMSAGETVTREGAYQAQIRAAQFATQGNAAMAIASTPAQQLEAINKQREAARQEVMQAQAEVAQAEQLAAQRRAAGQAPVMEEMVVAVERQKTAAEQLQQIEERRLSALRSGQESLKAQRDQQVESLKTAQQALQAEQDKNKSLAVRFAQLSEIERTQLKTINEKMQQGGQLGEADVAFLEQKGFGQQATEKFRVAQAQQQGFGSLVTDLGGGGAERERILTDQVKARQKQIDQTIGRVFEAQGEIEQAEAALVKAFEDRDAAIINSLKAAYDAAMKSKERIDRMQQSSRN